MAVDVDGPHPRPGRRAPAGRAALVDRGIAAGRRPVIESPVELGERALRGGGGRRRPPPAGPTWWPAAVPARPARAVVTQAGSVSRSTPGCPSERVHRARRRGGQVAGRGGGAVPRLRPGRAQPVRRGGGRRRRGGHRPGRVRRRLLPPGHRLRQRGHLAAGPGGRGHRGQDRASTSPRGRTWSVRSGSPRAVLCDTEVLATLPPREWASGRGEMAKYAFLGGSTRPGRARRLAARPAAGRAGGPVRGHQGRRGGRRRAGGRPADAPQLRPHAGPRPGGAGVRPRRRARPAPRRGGGRRAGLRRPAGPPARSDRRRSGGRCTGGWSAGSTSPPPCPTAPIPSGWSRSWPGTRRPTTI